MNYQEIQVFIMYELSITLAENQSSPKSLKERNQIKIKKKIKIRRKIRIRKRIKKKKIKRKIRRKKIKKKMKTIPTITITMIRRKMIHLKRIKITKIKIVTMITVIMAIKKKIRIDQKARTLLKEVIQDEHSGDFSGGKIPRLLLVEWPRPDESSPPASGKRSIFLKRYSH